MAYNSKKGRWECDCCGRDLGWNPKLQICKTCDDILVAKVKRDKEERESKNHDKG